MIMSAALNACAAGAAASVVTVIRGYIMEFGYLAMPQQLARPVLFTVQMLCNA